MKSQSKNIVRLLFLIIMTFTLTLIAQEKSNDEAPPSGTDSVDSWLGGLYGNYPILNKKELVECNKRLSKISEDRNALIIKRDSLQNVLDNLRKADSVKLKDHITFFGGLFTIPSLNEKEQKIKELHTRINKYMHAIRDNIEILNELELEEKKICSLIEKNKKYRMVKLLWGFANWEVEKK